MSSNDSHALELRPGAVSMAGWCGIQNDVIQLRHSSSDSIKSDDDDEHHDENKCSTVQQVVRHFDDEGVDVQSRSQEEIKTRMQGRQKGHYGS